MKATTKQVGLRLSVKSKKLKQLNGISLSHKQLAEVYGGTTSDGEQPIKMQLRTLYSQHC
ncbi:hypothetical protein CWB98_16220 [Pseudoalteromonas rubra]|uniref:Uncharacterized protein n=1 Tax=Pseudoalteromonas rubra TaxID=43658 RepID=A0A5S3WXG0_9GAMM|nr:hypothetical protein CWB98_16220 [Pseudoalteromonas rubra]